MNFEYEIKLAKVGIVSSQWNWTHWSSQSDLFSSKFSAIFPVVGHCYLIFMDTLRMKKISSLLLLLLVLPNWKLLNNNQVSMATNAIFKIYGSENWSKINLVPRFSFSLETNDNGNNKKEQRNIRLPGTISPNWLHRKLAHNIN